MAPFEPRDLAIPAASPKSVLLVTSHFYFASASLGCVFSHLQLVRGITQGGGSFWGLCSFLWRSWFGRRMHMARHTARDEETWGRCMGREQIHVLLRQAEQEESPRGEVDRAEWGRQGQGYPGSFSVGLAVSLLSLYTPHSPSSQRDGLRD